MTEPCTKSGKMSLYEARPLFSDVTYYKGCGGGGTNRRRVFISNGYLMTCRRFFVCIWNGNGSYCVYNLVST